MKNESVAFMWSVNLNNTPTEKSKTGRKTLKKLKIVQIDNNYADRFKKEGINVLKEMTEKEWIPGNLFKT